MEVELSRDGKTPLAFCGRLVASATTRTSTGPNQNRWDNYELYVTRAGKYVLAHEYHTQWQGESDRHEAWVGEDARAIILGAAYDDDGETVVPEVLVELAENAAIDISDHIE